jgi:hypothetical protein
MSASSIDRQADSRPLSASELLERLHKKFAQNFASSVSFQVRAATAEQLARTLWEKRSGLNAPNRQRHQDELSVYLDEIFGDCVCALYLASCGLNVPARTLLRRSLELGLAITSYWDSPVEFWQWRMHDGDIKFSSLLAQLQTEGYSTFLAQLPRDKPPDISGTLERVRKLYSDLSNVVHPKPYNFSTGSGNGYDFSAGEYDRTVTYAEQVARALIELLDARFPTQGTA